MQSSFPKSFGLFLSFLRLVAPLVLGVAFAGSGVSHASVDGAAASHPQELNDDAFLDDLERRAFRYFVDSADPDTGLIADRSAANGAGISGPASTAATGFGLTALCIGAQRGWIERAAAEVRTQRALSCLLQRAPQMRGFLPHFLDLHTGQRTWNSEYSSIDTAIMLCGALSVRQYFKGTASESLATKLYERTDWQWMCDNRGFIEHEWKPETGFGPNRWDRFSELLTMQLLAIGSPTHPLPATSWKQWDRGPAVTFGKHRFIQYPPLFVHQFPQAWVDYRRLRDDFGNYFSNAREATLAQRDFCVSLRDRFPGYSQDIWGLTSSDSAKGYVDWGGPPIAGQVPDSRIDGTVVPCAAAGSIPFAPTECIQALRAMKARYGDQIYGRYGFADAFNPTSGWVGRDVLGIDLGITLLMAENSRTGFVWNWFMRNTEISKAMASAGFRPLASRN